MKKVLLLIAVSFLFTACSPEKRTSQTGKLKGCGQHAGMAGY